MSTEQALPKGTRVEITDPEHPWVGDRGEIVSAWGDELWRVCVPTDEYAYAALRSDQFRVTEPTIGQLVDAMQTEIEATCKRMGWTIETIGISSWPITNGHVAVVRFTHLDKWREWGGTPQAALRAMIERLREVK